MDFVFITDQPDVAAFAERCGARRIFLDLEILGKQQRQAGRDTHISRHRPEHVAPVKAALRKAQLQVRLNPLHAGSASEVEAALRAGADLLMLPMFRRASELSAFCKLVSGRAPVIPLVETADAVRAIAEVVRIEGVAELYVGLNDLHLDLGQTFLFQPLVDGLVDRVAEACHAAGKPFGFGGIARLGEGLLAPELILGEHVRLGSRWVILSRAFHGRATTLEELHNNGDMGAEIDKLRAVVARLHRRTPHQAEADRQALCRQVAGLKTKLAAA
jgi:hypothetical protein